jgi:hypothetical protein
MTITIDGERREAVRVGNRLRVWGVALNGRRCIVSEHSFANLDYVLSAVKDGGAIRTNGHRYER